MVSTENKLKMWAAAIDATKHEPPNTLDFDGLRDGRGDGGPKSQGRTGPRAGGSSPSSEVTTMLLASMIPLITSQLSSAAHNLPSLSHSNSEPLSTLTQPRREVSPPWSPVPASGSEVHICLQSFLEKKGINLLHSEQALIDYDLTPDIISEIPISRLCEVLGTVEGHAHKYQGFAKEWSERLESKCRCVS
ncbi:hypothetical protein PAXINDRAFT_20541 [Paxillus involutus ATCC 200175]|uniref:Uncharacterized protein n=1 Tax=Paxillus involutus ATCC 200175 TaxID=664439 RepID=A0A0C9T4E6_PAXIN|nr:hypothetical protein PAXINDRAFT_20541 [Paxillus involutus ATCC 200175]